MDIETHFEHALVGHVFLRSRRRLGASARLVRQTEVGNSMQVPCADVQSSLHQLIIETKLIKDRSDKASAEADLDRRRRRLWLTAGLRHLCLATLALLKAFAAERRRLAAEGRDDLREPRLALTAEALCRSGGELRVQARTPRALSIALRSSSSASVASRHSSVRFL